MISGMANQSSSGIVGCGSNAVAAVAVGSRHAAAGRVAVSVGLGRCGGQQDLAIASACGVNCHTAALWGGESGEAG